LSAINLGSYNYLGYAENEGPITDSVEDTIKQMGVGVASSPNELGIFYKQLYKASNLNLILSIGTQQIYYKLEKLVAEFLGVEDSIVVGMGFATNSTSIPAIFGRGCLVISDEHNHASLILGCRLSGAKVKVFKHNS